MGDVMELTRHCPVHASLKMSRIRNLLYVHALLFETGKHPVGLKRQIGMLKQFSRARAGLWISAGGETRISVRLQKRGKAHAQLKTPLTKIDCDIRQGHVRK